VPKVGWRQQAALVHPAHIPKAIVQRHAGNHVCNPSPTVPPPRYTSRHPRRAGFPARPERVFVAADRRTRPTARKFVAELATCFGDAMVVQQPRPDTAAHRPGRPASLACKALGRLGAADSARRCTVRAAHALALLVRRCTVAVHVCLRADSPRVARGPAGARARAACTPAVTVAAPVDRERCCCVSNVLW
jgi:hypothetical protein